jgi:hypothetical protein
MRSSHLQTQNVCPAVPYSSSILQINPKRLILSDKGTND